MHKKTIKILSDMIKDNDKHHDRKQVIDVFSNGHAVFACDIYSVFGVYVDLEIGHYDCVKIKTDTVLYKNQNTSEYYDMEKLLKLDEQTIGLTGFNGVIDAALFSCMCKQIPVEFNVFKAYEVIKNVKSVKMICYDADKSFSNVIFLGETCDNKKYFYALCPLKPERKFTTDFFKPEEYLNK